MGFPGTDPEAVIVARIDAQTSLTTGTDLFMGPERAADPASGMPHAAVFVRQYQGLLSHDMGVTTDDRWFRLQVLVRGAPDARATALSTANAALAACNRVDPTETGYYWLDALDAGPIDLGLDSGEHPRFVFNVQLRFYG